MIGQIRNELYKLLLLRKGWVYVLIIVVIYGYLAVNNVELVNSRGTDDYEILIDYYYSKWGGDYDKSYEDTLMMYLVKTKSQGYLLEQDDNITDDIKLQMITSEVAYPAFEDFYARYTLASQNPMVDRVIDVRGYELLLVNYKDIDFFLVVIVLIISAVIFSLDNESGQEDVLKTTYRGHKQVILAKIFELLLIIVGVGVIKLLTISYSIGKVYDIGQLGLSLQSIGYMHKVKENVTVGEALAICVVSECIGAYVSALVTGYVTKTFKSPAAGFLIGVGLAYVPFFLLQKDKLYRSIPVPSGYLAAYNFLDSLTTYRIQYAMFLSLMIVMIMLTYRSHLARRKYRHAKKKV